MKISKQKMNVRAAATNGKPTVISTFAGCGGSSLGYKMAGFKELLAIDFDKNAVETFRLNFDCPIWFKDICEISGQEILDFCNIKKGELDVLDGSPPCQGFSTAGKRQVDDNRNDLFKEFRRLVVELGPKIFVMENVSGMIKGKMKGRFKEILNSLKDTGYNVKCKLMNSANYNVPQSRQRLIFIGVKNGNPVYPKQSKIITAREALQNCRTGREYGSKQCLKLYPYIDPGKSGQSIPKSIKNKFGYSAKLFSLIKINPDRPSPTLTGLTAGASGFLHWKEQRRLYVSEFKRLSTFPDSFKFVGNETDKIARIGNSVPPLFMKEIAKTIKNEILLNKASKNDKQPRPRKKAKADLYQIA